MTSPDLSRRVDRQDEDIRVISDTVVDTKEAVDVQSVTLDQHSVMLVEHGRDLAEIKSVLAGHGLQLAEILRLLRGDDEPGSTL